MKHIPTTHPISWFVEREREGNLTIRPNFQRRLVWANRQKSNLIESILLELPVPEIYMQVRTSPDGNSEYIVVDGQQRISAILEFIGASDREPFELHNLSEESRWSGYTFDNLDDQQKTRFFGHIMAVRYLQDAREYEIKDLFTRLNKYLTPLTPQELRNATYRGPFLRLSEQIAEDEYWFENRLAKPDAIRRMRDIEFISDLLIGVLDGPQGGNAKTLDDYYASFEDYKREFPGQRECRKRFYQTLELIQELLPSIRSTRWSNKTDFYTLFVALAQVLRARILPHDALDDVSEALHEFEREIGNYQETEDEYARDLIVDYVGAIQRGSSDRHRRGVRHRSIIKLLEPHFVARRRSG